MASSTRSQRSKAADCALLTLPIATPVGCFLATYTGAGLARLRFPGRKPDQRGTNGPIPLKVRRWHRQTTRAVERILVGKQSGGLPPLDLSAGSGFQREVWKALLDIPSGQTRGYGEIARTLNKPGAARAVGGACGANPVPLLIPCHRVLAANHRLGGFSGGLDWKRKLLAAEHVTLPV